MYTIHQFILKWHIMLKLFTNYNYQSYEIIMQLESYTGVSVISPKIKFISVFNTYLINALVCAAEMKDYNVKCVLQTRHIFLHIYIFLQWAPLASETTHAMYTSEYSKFTSNDTLYKNQPSNEIYILTYVNISSTISRIISSDYNRIHWLLPGNSRITLYATEW